MRSVELDVNPIVQRPFDNRDRCRAPKQRLKRPDVPTQQIHLQRGTPLDKPRDEMADRIGCVGLLVAGADANARVEVPANQRCVVRP